MEIRNNVELKVNKDQMECSLICNQDASLGFLFDAICEMRAYLVQKIKESEEACKQQENKV